MTVSACLKPCSNSLAKVLDFLVKQYLKSANLKIFPTRIRLSAQVPYSISGMKATSKPASFSSQAISFVWFQVPVFGPLFPWNNIVLWPFTSLRMVAVGSLMMDSRKAFLPFRSLISLSRCSIYLESGRINSSAELKLCKDNTMIHQKSIEIYIKNKKIRQEFLTDYFKLIRVNLNPSPGTDTRRRQQERRCLFIQNQYVLQIHISKNMSETL